VSATAKLRHRNGVLSVGARFAAGRYLTNPDLEKRTGPPTSRRRGPPHLAIGAAVIMDLRNHDGALGAFGLRAALARFLRG
jgi:hypothetical protein